MFMFTEYDEQHAAAPGYATLGPRRRNTCRAADCKETERNPVISYASAAPPWLGSTPSSKNA